jgi:glycerophosphoryl diester phosphodiesterase
MVEFDLRRCGSGELVVIHDETVGRVTDGSGRVGELARSTLAELDVLGSGEGVPTLRQVLAAVPEDTGLNVELKDRGLAADLVEALADHGHDVLVSSFDDEALRELRGVADLPVATVFADDHEGGIESALELDAVAVHPQWELLEEAFVERAHEHGLAVNTWTLRDDEAAGRVEQFDVDGLIADAPRFCG